jgi:hypothetical protein
MADGMRVQLLGGDTLARTTAAAAAELADLSAPGRAAGALLAARAAAFAPRRTGRLAGSIRVARFGPDGAEVATAVPYASFQEYGTRWVRPKFYMARALDTAADPVTDTYAAAVDRAVGQIRGQ